MPNRSTERVIEKKERVALLLCQAKRDYSRLTTQELFPCSSVSGERLYSQAGVCGKDQGINSLILFFLLHFLKDGVADKIRVYAWFYGEGKGNRLQYSCLENPIDGGAW